MDYTDDTDCVLCLKLIAKARTCMSADRDAEGWWVVLMGRRWDVFKINREGAETQRWGG
jgi:hypothetical protein